MFLHNHVICEDLAELYQRKIKWEKLMGKTILITGANGMIASYLVFMCIYLNDNQHYNIKLILNIRSYEKIRKRLGKYIDKDYIKLCEQDINKAIILEEDINFIIHGASLASSQYYDSIPIEVILPNVCGTIQLLKLAEKNNLEGFLMFSSGEIYGKVDSAVPVITEESMGTSNTLDLKNCYCESKRMAEMLCYAWFRQKEIPVKLARICHTYGPTMDIVNDKRVFASFVHNIVNNHNIVLNSDGSARRPFCYIADAVAGLFQILLEGIAGEAYNMCNSDEHLSILELAQILVDMYPQKNLQIELPQKNQITSSQRQNESQGIVTNEKLKRLGWNCKYNTRSGFYRTIESIQQQQELKI